MNTHAPFEERLLHRLKHAVDERPRRRPVRRRILAGGGIAVTAALGIGIGTLTAGTAAAYEITEDGESIVVDIKELTDAEGLEEALAEYGVKADVTYLPWGKQCAEGRFTPAEFESSDHEFGFVTMTDSGDDGKIKGIKFEIRDFDTANTLVIELGPHGDGHGRFNSDFGGIAGVTTGEIGECELEDVDPGAIFEPGDDQPEGDKRD